MSNRFNIAHVYAKAVFNLSIECENSVQWGKILESLAKISQNSTIQLLRVDLLGLKNLSNLLISIFEDYSKKKLDYFGRNFIQIIVKNNRISLLSIIFKEFNNLYNNYINYAVIEVVSAHKLNDSQLKKITEIMEHRLSKKVEAICHIDRSILAGIIIKVNNTVIDGSLVGKMLRLRNMLQF